MSYVIHVVVAHGSVSEDVYVGRYLEWNRAQDRAHAIERAAERAGGEVTALVREVLPSSVSLADILADAGFDT